MLTADKPQDEHPLILTIRRLTKGIDQTESENSAGWWETSVGAAHGAEVLNQVLVAVTEYVGNANGERPWWIRYLS